MTTVDDPPEGYRWEWVPDADLVWSVGSRSAGRCRYKVGPDGACAREAVASMNRGRLGHDSWWDYCEEHLYGRRIVDGVVVVRRMVPDR